MGGHKHSEDFGPHGSFSLALAGRVACIQAAGTWSEMTTLAFVKAFRSLVRPLGNEPWAVLTDLRRWELGVPEMEPPMDELDQWCVANGQTTEATVLPDNPLIRAQLEHMFSHTQTRINRAYFRTPETAAEWLRDQGFALDEARLLAFCNFR